MKALSGLFDAWSYSVFQCCRPPTSYLSQRSHDRVDLDNSFVVVQDEPSFAPMPGSAPLRSTLELLREERASRKTRGSGWSSFSTKKRASSSNDSISRRPHISAPTNFRHVYSESFQFPNNTLSESQLPRTSFRPLELNLTSFDTQISPLLPQLDNSSPPVTPPPRVYTSSNSSQNYSPAISHGRSYSSMSFQIPRRPVNDGFVFDSLRSNTSTPQRPQLTMARSYTSPPAPAVEDLVQRVAHAMLERDKLQEQLDDVVERQSAYANSRPSTAHKQPELESMPVIVVTPPTGLSFSERLSSDRSQGTSIKSSTGSQYEANSSRKIKERAPPPPLPLRLRPPLRKKKSFSMMSTWLRTAEVEPKQERSHNSLPIEPKPITDCDGFYHVAHPGPNQRSSFDSESTVSDWTIEDDQHTPTRLSPSNVSTPRATACPRQNLATRWREPVRFHQRDNMTVAF